MDDLIDAFAEAVRGLARRMRMDFMTTHVYARPIMSTPPHPRALREETGLTLEWATARAYWLRPGGVVTRHAETRYYKTGKIYFADYPKPARTLAEARAKLAQIEAGFRREEAMAPAYARPSVYERREIFHYSRAGDGSEPARPGVR